MEKAAQWQEEEWEAFRKGEAAQWANWAELTADELRLVTRPDRNNMLRVLSADALRGLEAKLTAADMDAIRAASREHYTAIGYGGKTPTSAAGIAWLDNNVECDDASRRVVVAGPAAGRAPGRADRAAGRRHHP
ncbi:hypothetical protein [Kitasatospora sp. GAS204B]|uniref:hypothetical protein n=1 Tax=unclassified Kitasatospora TaxID=2633591 RepID=UPI002476D8E7|nr:hypothetical protein [Kitasatospora sp. GAS204B]MDH6122930.1 hypothetical protein [Kitasatospora sp. GAS204B]